MLNGLLQKKQGVIINVLEDKHCAFAQTENDEQVFIEPKFTTGLKLQVADQVEMVVISNTRFTTQWKAIKVELINQHGGNNNTTRNKTRADTATRNHAVPNRRTRHVLLNKTNKRRPRSKHRTRRRAKRSRKVAQRK